MKNFIIGILLTTTAYLIYEISRPRPCEYDEIDFDNEASPLNGMYRNN